MESDGDVRIEIGYKSLEVFFYVVTKIFWKPLLEYSPNEHSTSHHRPQLSHMIPHRHLLP
ncbi:hypothetical protein Hanom_Chr04g00316011 [Helianthus anomalus]